ncbi:MAG: polysaccharide deacetylase family protein [Deltaproteobacteria bacterium]|jgi:peptidoglycan/xylan/chitin deacetylase (PgdA/CDA1 family)
MRLRELSIIQYQNVSTKPHLNQLWLSLNAFEKQMDHISKNGFRVLSMDAALQFMTRVEEIRKTRPLALTFDNGYRDFYDHAFPLLARHAYPATVLLSPQKVGTSFTAGGEKVEYLSWSMIEDLAKSDVIIGAYEDQRRNINDIPEETVQKHITEYKKVMEDRLGVPIRYFGVKEGVPKPEIRDLLISEGYRAFLTECPTNQKPDLYAVGRIQVDDDDFNIFLTKISRTYLFFKDKKSWKYIREYGLDKAAHRLSEAYERIRTGSRHKA